MTEKSLAKKKIYQVAKEINISHETLIDYLVKKGHVIKSHMTIVDEDRKSTRLNSSHRT